MFSWGQQIDYLTRSTTLVTFLKGNLGRTLFYIFFCYVFWLQRKAIFRGQKQKSVYHLWAEIHLVVYLTLGTLVSLHSQMRTSLSPHWYHLKGAVTARLCSSWMSVCTWIFTSIFSKTKTFNASCFRLVQSVAIRFFLVLRLFFSPFFSLLVVLCSLRG